MATIHTDFHHSLFGFNRKAVRGFYFIPATGRWAEVKPESLYRFWKERELYFTDNHDTYVHSSWCDGHLRHIAVLMLANENKKDTYRVARRLECIRLEETLDAKREYKYLKVTMAS